MNRLQRLAQKANSFSMFLTQIKSYPHWYLQTDEQITMNKAQFEIYYQANH